MVDLTDAFHNWKILEEDSFLLGFFDEHREQYGRYLFAPFGLKCAPGINDQSVKEILRLLKLHSGIHLDDWVDDFIAATPSHEQSWIFMERTVEFLLSVGIPVSFKSGGLLPPSMHQTWVGWHFNMAAPRLEVPAEKCKKGRSRIEVSLLKNSQGSLKVKEFLGCVGLLNHIAEICLEGRRKLVKCRETVNASGVQLAWGRGKKVNPVIKLSNAAILELNWWFNELLSPPWRWAIPDSQGFLSLWCGRSPEVRSVCAQKPLDSSILV